MAYKHDDDTLALDLEVTPDHDRNEIDVSFRDEDGEKHKFSFTIGEAEEIIKALQTASDSF